MTRIPDCTARGHIVDSHYYSGGYTTKEARRVFCDKYRYQRWLDVEAALAGAQAELGLIPREAADSLIKTAHLRFLDLAAIRQGVLESSHSLMPLLRAWQQASETKAGQFVHFGATTQDIQDTAQSMEMRDILDIVERDLLAIISQIVGLAKRYTDLVIIGRTHAQHALPMTLGLKMAVWMDELWRDRERLSSCRDRVIVSQLFGGVGTMDAFGDKAFDLLDKFSTSLGLNAPLTAWHACRDRGAEFMTTMAMIAGTCARIANEIRCLSRNEIGELEEPFQMGKVGSSTMPHKRNPEMCEQVIVLAKLIKANAGLGFDGLINEHERDYRAVRLEWVTITDTSHFICGLLAITQAILKGLIVHEHRIRENVKRAATFICSEALMFHLGNKIGKQKAHQVVYEASMEAIEKGRDLMEVLMGIEVVAQNFDRKELETTIEPASHIGVSKELTQRVIDRIAKQQGPFRVNEGSERQCPIADTNGECSLTGNAAIENPRL